MSTSLPKKTVAITGAGSGLGLGLAKNFAAKGYKVFGTAFSEEEILTEKPNISELDITLTICNITRTEDVKNWADVVTISTEAKGLDLLINNAGVLTPGPMELIPLDAIRHEFEINVFGSLSVINSFLPLLRIAKGRILQIGSASGIFPLPYSGPSSASKATMEAFADVFRVELKPFDIDFVMVEPGNMATGGPAKTAAQMKQVTDNMTEGQHSLYGGHFAKFSEAFNKMQGGGLSIDDAAQRVIAIADQVPAPTRAQVGEDAAELISMVKIKTDEELDAVRRDMFNLND